MNDGRIYWQDEWKEEMSVMIEIIRETITDAMRPFI